MYGKGQTDEHEVTVDLKDDDAIYYGRDLSIMYTSIEMVKGKRVLTVHLRNEVLIYQGSTTLTT